MGEAVGVRGGDAKEGVRGAGFCGGDCVLRIEGEEVTDGAVGNHSHGDAGAIEGEGGIDSCGCLDGGGPCFVEGATERGGCVVRVAWSDPFSGLVEVACG